ncbi:hypothetical protein BH11PSE10_BH11PSE10_13960 [soil metagenome]
MPPAADAALTPSHSAPEAVTPSSLFKRSRSQPRTGDRLVNLAALALALGCAVAGLTLAAHHPLSPALAVACWLLAAAFAARFVTQTPLLLLGALPWIGLAPWSGWITFEELDLLVLACAAGAYAALPFRGLSSTAGTPRVPAWRRVLSFSPLTLLLLALFAGSLLLAMQRGFADAGGFNFGWFQGYHEAMNSLRQTKPFFLVALLLPLWVQAGKRQPQQLAQALLWGMLLALAGASLACLAERQAFTGLLNFSTDYRSTGLFWEMHVGGAALDGCLALTLPFCALALLHERRPWRFGLLLLLTVLAAYAVLTTFSRGLYVAVPLGLAVLMFLNDGQRRRAVRLLGKASVVAMPLPGSAKVGALLMAGAFTAAAVLVFGGGGYRGLLALLGVMALLLAMPASLWLPGPAQRVTGLLMAALLAALLTGAGWTLAMAVPKAAYVQYVLAFVVAVWLRWKDRPGVVQPVYACLVTTAWFWLLGCMAVVAGDWGGELALANALLALLLLGALWPLFWLWPALWPLRGRAGSSATDWRRRSLLFTGLVLASAVIASLGGGDYVHDRAASWKEDLQTREAHWKQGLALLDSRQEWLFGQGSGRFVANHFFAGPVTQHTGDYRLIADAGSSPHLVLTGGKHLLGYGALFRVSQRIEAPKGLVQLSLRVRAPKDVVLQTEICEKQLLYSDSCLSAAVSVKAPADGAAASEWQSLTVPMGTAGPMGGSWYAPRFVTFSVAVDTTGGVADIAGLRLSDGSGKLLLSNGDFSAGMAHWFFSSDRYHLPWHIKNLGLHVLFEQGLVGVALLGALLLMALLRLAFGRGREHLLAPALAASLVGFLGVGLFDSLLDVPRIGFIFYVVLLFSLGLRALPGSAGAEPSK